MNSELKNTSKQPLSRQKAIDLLHENNDCFNSPEEYIDEYGNYIFPTDLVIKTPNTAYGVSHDIALISSSNSNDGENNPPK